MNITDQDIRDSIFKCNKNVAIVASAGTGKTYVLIQQIIKEYNELKNWQTVAAITFTRKAANELKQRLPFKLDYGFVGTNDAFIFCEIINPFLADAYGEQYKNIDLIQDFKAQSSVRNFNEGLKKIEETGQICTYCRGVLGNFSFQLACNILEKSKAACLYLKSKFFKIYIDEYQDTDKDMHSLFMELNRLGILLFVVGDSKQAIYRFRGGNSEYLEHLIVEPTFTHFELKYNFRSNIQIQNYSNIMTVGQEYKYSLSPLDNKVKYINANSVNAKVFIDWASEDECCILLRRNDDGIILEREIKLNGGDFIYIKTPPIEDATYESQQVYVSRNATRFLIDENYNEYLYCDNIIGNCDNQSIKRHLKALKGYFNNKEFDEIIGVMKVIYDEIGYVFNDTVNKEIMAMVETLEDKQYWNFYKSDNYKHKIMTMHGSKGLQFKKVIVDCKSFNTVDLLNINSDDYKLHYVALTRAKEEMLLLINSRYYSYYCERIKATSANIAESL